MPDTSQLDFYQLGLAAALAANTKLTVNEGDMVDFILNGAAAMADFCDQRRAHDHLVSTVDGAEDDDLTELASDHFDVDRQPATAAQATVEFSRPSAGGGEPAGTLLAGFEVGTAVDRTGAEVRFVTDTDLSIALSDLGPFSVSVTAIVEGPEGNVETVGLINRMISTAFDETLSVVSTTTAAGGNDEESDEEVRKRIRARPLTLRKATKAALLYGALEVDSVRVSEASEDAFGNVVVAVSDNDGNSNIQMINDVLIEMENWRAFGIPIGVTGGVRVLVDMNIQIRVKEGGALANLSTPIITAVSGEINKLTQGEFLYDTVWKSATRNVAPELIVDAELTSFSIGGVAQSLTEDYVGTATNELLRPGTITVTVV